MKIYSPLNVTWYLTSHCNLQCEYCYFSNEYTEQSDIHYYEKCIKEIVELNPYSVTLIGGEIFTLKHIDYILKLLSSTNLKINLATNGSLINDEIINELSNIKNINIVQIGLDSCLEEINKISRKTSDFKLIDDVISKLIDKKIIVDVSTVLSKININYFEEFIKYLLDKKVRRVNVVPFMSFNLPEQINEKYQLNQEELRVFFNKLKDQYSNGTTLLKVDKPIYSRIESKNIKQPNDELKLVGCGAGIFKCVILPNGDVCGCENIQDPVFIEGNIQSQSLKDIWFNPEKFALWRKPQKLSEKCENCEIFEECQGGCKANAYTPYSGNFEFGDPNCWRC